MGALALRADPRVDPSVAVFGPAFYAAFNAAFESADFAAWMLIVTGIVLIATRTFRVGNASVNVLSALAMGVAQVFALLPGLSRSALTMATGFALGVERVRVARFSFLMAVPVIIGANIYELTRIRGVAGVDPVRDRNLTAFVSGLSPSAPSSSWCGAGASVVQGLLRGHGRGLPPKS
jgi:undecaprenyl-diphosphatase